MQTGSNWAGEYSRWAFNESKQFVMVAKELKSPGTGQSVPLMDNELNEQAEILLTLQRRFIERSYGDGTESLHGFEIVQSGSNPTNNFTIKGGSGTADTAGWCFAGGWMAINLSDIEFSAQGISQNLTTPVGNRRDEVYLDVSYREVGPDSDSDISEPLIGFETSRRIKLAWEVRVAEGSSPTAKYNDANGLPHWTFVLASIDRLAGNAQITTAMITDLRRKQLALRRREYVHVQASGAALWTVNHNLGSNYLGIEVFKATGESVEPGQVLRTNINTLTIDFDGQSISGHAIVRGLTTYA